MRYSLLMLQVAREGSGSESRVAFLGAVGAAVLLPYVPFARMLVWPLVLFGTLMHELGHGLTALLVGGRFESLVVHWNGSGVAQTATSGRLTAALVAAGGLVGPACAGALALALARSPRRAHQALAVFGAFLLACDVLFIRSLCGLVIATGAAALMLWLWRRGTARMAQFALAFVGVELALASFASRDYLFSRVAHTASGDLPSDVAAMSSALWLPYWVWGGVCAVFSMTVLALGVFAFLRSDRSAPAR